MADAVMRSEMKRPRARTVAHGGRSMIAEATIIKAVDLLLQAAPAAKVVLFGSYARGDAAEESDVDLLVIEPEVRNRLEETHRLREVVRHLRVPVDVLVASQEQFEYWAETPGTVYYEAATEGKIFEALS